MSKADRYPKNKKEPLYVRIIKYLMLALYTYGAVFWGSTALLSLLKGAYADFSPPAWVGVCMGAGEALLIGAMVLTVLKKYIFAFLASAAGASCFLAASGWLVKTARHEIENRVVPNDLLDLDKRYMYRAIPVLAGAVLSLLLAAVSIISSVRKKKQKKAENENRPVKSIID